MQDCMAIAMVSPGKVGHSRCHVSTNNWKLARTLGFRMLARRFARDKFQLLLSHSKSFNRTVCNSSTGVELTICAIIRVSCWLFAFKIAQPVVHHCVDENCAIQVFVTFFARSLWRKLAGVTCGSMQRQHTETRYMFCTGGVGST